MTMLTDAEQNQLNDELDGPITHKIKRMLSQAEQRILQQVAPIQDKVEQHDGFITNFAQSFSHVSGFLQKATGKK
jgi:hypothetical protein